MNFDRAIFQTFGPIFEGRLYPSTFIQVDGTYPLWPAGRYSIIDAVPPEDICGTGNGDEDDVRVQIDICAEAFDDMRALTQQVIDRAELGLTVATTEVACPARRQSLFVDYDSDAKVHRAVIDFILSPSSN
jgi:hypothetical protein